MVCFRYIIVNSLHKGDDDDDDDDDDNNNNNNMYNSEAEAHRMHLADLRSSSAHVLLAYYFSFIALDISLYFFPRDLVAQSH